MKKDLNVIQIKGIRGILYLAFLGCCFAAGFAWFPGWLCMKLWNIASLHFIQIPAIGILQGMLLWGIIAGAYFTFRKDKLVVCMKASDGLSEDELRDVFANIKKQIQNDKFMTDMLKAHHAELKIKNLTQTGIPGVSVNEIKKMSPENADIEQSKKIQTK